MLARHQAENDRRTDKVELEQERIGKEQQEAEGDGRCEQPIDQQA
jgi:hypothetical protein